jgi:hypothetical protein
MALPMQDARGGASIDVEWSYDCNPDEGALTYVLLGRTNDPSGCRC